MDKSRGAAARVAAMARATQRSPGQPYNVPIIQTRQKMPKIGRNDPCPCNSGKKYKKCCLRANQPTVRRRDPSKLPREKPVVPGAQVIEAAAATQAPDNKNATAMAMINAKVDHRIVWAYLETSLYITDVNRNAHPADNLAKWDAALAQFDAATDEERQILLAPALPDVD